MNVYDKCFHGKRLDDRCDACILLDQAERRRDAELAALRRVAEAAERVTELSEVFDHPAFKGRGFQTLDAALAELKKVRDGEKGDGE